MSPERQSDLTRQKLLDVAADEIYHVGFQAASIGEILKKAGVSKGALYHHFPNKQDLGYAVVDEIFAAGYRSEWGPILSADDPVGALVDLIRQHHSRMQGDTLTCGCPLNNLAQEMSPLDEGFRRRVQQVFDEWREGLAAALVRSQDKGIVRRDVQPRPTAAFIVASLQGAIIMAKNAQDSAVFGESVQGVLEYLEGLKV
jgi:TetR/AcrR family transcriptional regulator, transcriptional repressor for nem operon